MVKYSRAGGMYQETLSLEERAYRAGLIAGAVTLVALLGLLKDLFALLTPSGRGQLSLGSFLLRYTRHEHVWFGYRFTGHEALWTTSLHLLIYAGATYGLLTQRRWGWALTFVYVLAIPLSEVAFAILSPMGYWNRQSSVPPLPRVEWFLMVCNLLLALLTSWLLWRYRDVFVR